MELIPEELRVLIIGYSNDITRTILLHVSKEFMKLVIVYKFSYVPKYMVSNAVVCENNLNLLNWVIENKCYWDGATCLVAAEYGYLEMLRCCQDNGCPWDYHMWEVAARHGHINILEYCNENNCPFSENTVYYATKYDHLQVIIWLRENRLISECSIEYEDILQLGNMRIIKWLVEDGYAKNSVICSGIAHYGYFDILKYCLLNGYDAEFVCFHAQYHVDISNWLKGSEYCKCHGRYH